MTNTTERPSTLTLTDFLLARIAEDEGAARYATRAPLATNAPEWGGWWFGHHDHYRRHDPARVLAECEAKRRIVFRLSVPDPHDVDEVCGDCEVLYLLALPYADHPDYRSEWRP